MINPSGFISFIFSSIKNRILVVVVLFELAAYGTILLYTNHVYEQELLAQKNIEIRQTFSASMEKINNMSDSMERNAMDMARFGESLYHFKKNSLIDLKQLEQSSERFLLSNFNDFAEALGGGIWYEPFVLDKETQYFGPYAFHDDKSVVFSWDLNTPQYDYHHQDWYTVANVSAAKRIGMQPRAIEWTEPYYDEAGTFSLMMTVDALMYDENGTSIGMATVDWALNELTTFLDKVKISTNAHPFFIYQGNGKFLSYPKNKQMVLELASEFDWGRQILSTSALDQLLTLENVMVDEQAYQVYYYRTPRGFIFGALMPLSDLSQPISAITTFALMAGLSIAVIFIVLMLLLIQQLFKPFDRVLSLIKGSIINGADDDNTVLIRPIDYPKKNEFTPIIEALGDIYRQVSAYLKEIEDSKLQIGTLNAQLEEKVLLRTTQLEKKTRESVVALEQLKVTQQQLIENEKHAALGRLVAGVAHEINTPLGISVTAASCIERDLKTTFENMLEGKLKRSQLKGSYQELKEGCQILNDNLVRAAELVASFKQVAVDQSSIEYRHIELGAYINQILLSLKPRVARTTHQIQVNCESDIELYTQPGALAQIITNLIDNAIIHAFEEQTDGLITLSMQQKEDWVEINVTDNGKGMSATVLNSIFEPFFTTRRNQGGSGLGMHLVYNLVTQKLNGKISCGSVEGEGSSFVIVLPIKVRMSQAKQ